MVLCHIVPDVLRNHPLSPARGENEMTRASDFTKRAADLLTEQLRQTTGVSPDDVTVVIETGNPEDEIVRIAEDRDASLVVLGSRKHEGLDRVFGRTAERVVRYAPCPVLVARASEPTRKLLVATDFSEASLVALELAKVLVAKTGLEGTLLHVMQSPSVVLPAIASPLGSPVVPPGADAVEKLEELGRETLAGLAKSYGFSRAEQVEGDPAAVIVARAAALPAEMILLATRGRTGLRRLVLGSTAEKVAREAECSVLVAR
jgi:nucleotide-binding universal stress UspA family protein